MSRARSTQSAGPELVEGLCAFRSGQALRFTAIRWKACRRGPAVQRLHDSGRQICLHYFGLLHSPGKTTMHNIHHFIDMQSTGFSDGGRGPLGASPYKHRAYTIGPAVEDACWHTSCCRGKGHVSQESPSRGVNHETLVYGVRPLFHHDLRDLKRCALGQLDRESRENLSG